MQYVLYISITYIQFQYHIVVGSPWMHASIPLVSLSLTPLFSCIGGEKKCNKRLKVQDNIRERSLTI